MRKKGSLSLSINAIVVLILAITMLGLGLGFIPLDLKASAILKIIFVELFL